jgi:hypothetical protein
MADPTIDSTSNPQTLAVAASIFRWVLTVLGVSAWWYNHFTDAQTLTILGAIITLATLAWHAYEPFRQARMRHAAAVASARGGKAVQHKDYTP